MNESAFYMIPAENPGEKRKTRKETVKRTQEQYQKVKWLAGCIEYPRV